MGVRMSLTADLRNAQRVQRLIEIVGSRAILKTVGVDQVSWIDQNFRAEGKEERWRPLKPATIKRRRNGSSRILQDIGTLKDSMVVGQPISESDTEIMVGSMVKYADMHHSGTARGIPARPILPSSGLAARRADAVIAKMMRVVTDGAA